jgi:flagellar motor switch protein FliN
MLDLNQWKRGVQIQIAGLELILENIFRQKFTISLQSAESVNDEEIEQQIESVEMAARFFEKKFQSEISFGFNDTWVDLLAEKRAQKNASRIQIEEDAIIELSENIIDIITSTLAEAGVEVEVDKVEAIRAKELSGSFNQKKYFSASLEFAPALENNESQNRTDLKLWVALSHPNEEQLSLYEKKSEEENPYIDGRYSDMMVNYVRQRNNGSKNDAEEFKRSMLGKEQEVEFEDFSESQTVKNDLEVRNIDLLKDVGMHVTVELGRRKMPLGDILKLAKGSVIELEKLAGEPVEILVNGHKIATGDVVVIDEYFGVRISDLLASEEHIKELQ